VPGLASSILLKQGRNNTQDPVAPGHSKPQHGSEPVFPILA